MQLPLKIVEFDKWDDTIRVRVPQHEIAALECAHGSMRVRVVADAEETAEFEPPELEFLRLRAKYPATPEFDPIRAAFPRGAGDIDAAYKRAHAKAA